MFRPFENVCVVVVNYNRCKLLRACLESLSHQRCIPSDVILVDNGSSDGSVEMAETEFAGTGRLPLRVIRNSRNLGFCEANNQGIRMSEAPLVALLNNDAEADPRWLEQLSKAFLNHPDVGMAASKILVHSDPSKIDKAGHLIYWDGQNRGRGTGQVDRGQFDEVEEVIWPDGCAAMYRREMLEAIGGFDEDFFAYADDAELGLRARIAGWRCLYMPEARVLHHRGSTLGTYAWRRIHLIERNRVLLVWKWFPWSLVCLNGAYLMKRLFAGARAAAQGKGEAARVPGWTGKIRIFLSLMTGTLAALPLVPKMLWKRWSFRSRRRLNGAQVKELLGRHQISLRELSEGAI